MKFIKTIITAIAALEENAVSPDRKFRCPGFFVLGNGHWKCWQHKGHSMAWPTSLEGAHQVSTGFWFLIYQCLFNQLTSCATLRNPTVRVHFLDNSSKMFLLDEDTLGKFKSVCAYPYQPCSMSFSLLTISSQHIIHSQGFDSDHSGQIFCYWIFACFRLLCYIWVTRWA